MVENDYQSQQMRPTGAPEEKLPFEPRTILIGLWLRAWIFVVISMLAVLGGIVAAKVLGVNTYAAETVVLYKPSTIALQSDNQDEVLPIDTLMHMVKVRTNLEEVQKRLGIDVQISIIGYACDVEVRRDTTLMAIQCYWGERDEVAAIANTLRDVFLENVEKIHVATIESLFEEVLQEKKTVDSKRDEIDKMITDLSKMEEAEKAKVEVEPDNTHIFNRMYRIRDAIRDDKEQRRHMVNYEEARLNYEKAKHLFSLGAIPAEEVERARIAMQKLKEIVYEPKEVQGWRDELDRLNEAIMPKKGKVKANPTGLSRAAKEARLKLQLESVAVDERLKYLHQLKEDILSGSKIGQNDASDFTVVSEAEVPSYPSHSTRKIIFLGVCFAGGLFGFFVIAVLVLIDTTLKSSAEVSLKMGRPMLGVLPKIGGRQNIAPAEEGSALLEQFKIMSRKVRSEIPKRGAKMLVVSTKAGEGKTMVSTNLAACFGRQDERVLLVDANVRSLAGQNALGDLLISEQGPVKGLGEYLSYEADSIDEIIWPTTLPGVECVPRVGKAVIPDVLGSNRMKEFLDECAERYSVILIDSPSLQSFVDAELLAQVCDAIIFVVQSHFCKYSQIKKILERLKTVKAPISGVILNRVDKLYLEVD